MNDGADDTSCITPARALALVAKVKGIQDRLERKSSDSAHQADIKHLNSALDARYVLARGGYKVSDKIDVSNDDELWRTEVNYDHNWGERPAGNVCGGYSYPLGQQVGPGPYAIPTPALDPKAQPGDNTKEGATKYDAGKPRLALVLGGFAEALEWVAKVGTFGAKKYSPNGWKKVPNGQERYEDALYRHWNAYLAGEEIDPESGLPHLAHMAWGVLAVMEYKYGNIQGRNSDSE